MSNLGRLAGSSFMQIFISLQMCGDMPGGMVGRSPSSATWEHGRAGQCQKRGPSPACDRQSPYLREGWLWALLRWASPPLPPLPAGCLGPAVPDWCALPSPPLTFMPISMLDKSAKGTSRVTSSHSSTAKLHMSAERLLISSGFFCKAVGNPPRGAEWGRGRGRGRAAGWAWLLAAHLLVPPRLVRTSSPGTGRRTSRRPC